MPIIQWDPSDDNQLTTKSSAFHFKTPVVSGGPLIAYLIVALALPIGLLLKSTVGLWSSAEKNNDNKTNADSKTNAHGKANADGGMNANGKASDERKASADGETDAGCRAGFLPHSFKKAYTTRIGSRHA